MSRRAPAGLVLVMRNAPGSARAICRVTAVTAGRGPATSIGRSRGASRAEDYMYAVTRRNWITIAASATVTARAGCAERIGIASLQINRMFVHYNLENACAPQPCQDE